LDTREADEQRWSNWLTKAQQGDSRAYESLLRELAPVIRAYLISRFGHFSLLDDCVQESLLALHAGRHSYNAKRPFRPWMFAIVRNRTIDLLRKQHPEGEATEPPATAPDHSLSIDGSRLLAKLSEQNRDAVLMTKFLGMSTRECADQLAVSENVVKVRVHRGLSKLRDLWNAE
jgi:RNA polymerase sigma-70 factor (ECF subfamily)